MGYKHRPQLSRFEKIKEESITGCNHKPHSASKRKQESITGWNHRPAQRVNRIQSQAINSIHDKSK
jgi:hypothetical protein